MIPSLISTPSFEGRMNRDDTLNGAEYKDKFEVKLGAIKIIVQLYL